MKGTQLFALFIIGFMVFSTIAFVLSAANNNQNNQQTPDANTPANTTNLTFTAIVDANVLEVFSSFKMAASTKEFDIAKIDSTIAKIDGISNISSSFRPNMQSSTGESVTYYIADVSFDSKKTSFAKISGAIEESTMTFFDSVGFFNSALIVVPKKILLKNADLNLSKEYELPDTVLQAFLNAATIKGDNILAQLEYTFSGEQPISSIASEVSNSSQQVKQHSSMFSFPLLEKMPKLTFTADANYSDMADKNQLEKELLKIKDVNSVEMTVGEIYYEMLLEIRNPSKETATQDINGALLPVAGISSISFQSDKNILYVITGFSKETKLLELKEKIATQLKTIGYSDANFSFTEPTVNYSGSISLSTPEAKAPAEAVKALFSSKNFFSKVYQDAVLRASSLTDMETGQSFIVDSNSINAVIFPVHSNGEEIFAQITFFSQRGQLLDAQAVEIINPVRLN